MRRRNERRHTLLVTGIGFALGILYLFDIRDSLFFDLPMVDAADYLTRAREVAAGHSPWPDVAFFKPPLYVYFLGGLLRLDGPGIWLPLFIQALMGAFSAALLFRISRRFLAPRWAVLAALLFLAYAPLAYFQGQLLIVSLYLLLSLATLLLVLRAGDEEVRRARLVPVLGAGAAWGLALLARPTAFLWGVPLALWLGWPRRGRRPLAGIGRTIVFLVAGFLVVMPVTLRNWRAEGVWVPISSNGGINFYIGNNPRFEETLALRPGLEWEELATMPERRGLATNSAESSQAFYQQSHSYMRREPGSFFAGWGKKLLQVFSAYRIDRNLDFESYARDSWWLRFSPVRFATLGPLALCGVVLAWRRRPRPVPIALYLAGSVVGMMTFFVTERYRVAVLPAFAFFAAIGVERLVHAIRGAIRGVVRGAPAEPEVPAAPERRSRFRGLLGPAAILLGSLIIVVGDPAGVRHLDYSRPDYDQAQVLARRGRLEEARAAYERARARDPGSPDVHFQLGLVLENQGEPEQAVIAYERASRSASGSYKPHWNRALLLKQLQRIGQAEEAMDRTLELEPTHESCRLNRALLRAGRQDWNGALVDLEVALGVPPGTQESIGFGESEERFAHFVERVCEGGIPADRFGRHLMYGNLLQGAGEVARSLAFFDQVRGAARQPPMGALAELELRRGRALILLDRHPDAEAALVAAERHFRSASLELPAAWHVARGETLYRTGEPESAVLWIEQALVQEPSSANAHYALACARALLGQSQGALASLARAIDSGLRDRARVESDRSLISLRDRADFRELLRAMENR